jgi:DNA phosphorothioation-associated DGQHR protein 1
MNAQPLPFLRVQAIAVRQRIGTFYIASISAAKLLQVCFSERLHAIADADGGYHLEGTQRALMDERLQEIAKYINTPESAFPNSIILAANAIEGMADRQDSDTATEGIDDIRWRVVEEDNCLWLEIPTAKRLAAVIDGQHRLFAYSLADSSRQEDQLVCSVFFDLPTPVQAYLFATINSKQRPVSKSQTYDLFGYNIEDEPASRWDPDKLAVFLSRRLNTDERSKLKGRISIAAQNDIVLSKKEARNKQHWMVSMATIVQGITRLISSNPSADARWLQTHSKSSRADLPTSGRKPVFRSLYQETNDETLYQVLINFFLAVDELLWSKANDNSYIYRTIGIQALMDALREFVESGLNEHDLSTPFFTRTLKRASQVDFSDNFFEASGRGRTRVRNILLLASNIKNLNEFAVDEEGNEKADYQGYKRIMDALPPEVAGEQQSHATV